MFKSRLGISVGLVGAAVYFLACFGGITPTLLLVGYILLAEDNPWLRKTAVKAIALLLLFSLVFVLIGFIPDAVSVLQSVVSIFGIYLDTSVVSSLFTVLSGICQLVEKILFIVLGIRAIGQGTVSVPIVDKLIDNYMM